MASPLRAPNLPPLFEAFFEHNLDAMVLSLPDGRCLRANPAACALLKMTEAQLLEVIQDAVARGRPEVARARAARGPDGRGVAAFTLRRGDGSTFQGEFTASPELEAEGVRFGVATLRDLSAHRSTEAALQAATMRAELSEQATRALAGQTSDVIWTLDLATLRYTYVSEGIRALRGLSQQEAMEESPADSLTPESLERVRAQLRKIGTPEEQDPHLGVYDQPHRDGSLRHVEITTTYLRDESGTPVQALGISRDATARVRAERALRESEALYRSLFNLAPSGVVLIGEGGRFLAFNDLAASQLGYTREELAALRITDVDLRAGEQDEAARRHAPAADRIEYDTRHRTRSGELRDVHVKAVKVDQGGRPGLLATWDDVTEARHMERELRLRLKERDEREQWLQASQRVALLGHYVYDIPADRWEGSQTLYELLGHDPDEPHTGATWVQRVHPEDAPGMAAYLQEVIAHRAGFDREYRVVRRPDEAPRWLHGMGDIVRDEAGRATKMVGTIQDVTARKEAEQAREALAAQLREAQRLESIGRLAGGVAHDFNNILLIILTCGGEIRERLQAGKLPHQVDVDELLVAADRARSLTAQLLAFARRQVVAPVVLDLNHSVKEAARMLERLLGEPVQLELRLENGLWPVTSDPGQLQQVLVNLAVNARDAMPRGGALTITTANAERPHQEPGWHGATPPAGPAVRLVVEDTGTGIPESEWPRLFEPFYTTKPRGAGTGLGLATVYGIVQQSQATIRFRSQPGKGTAFEIWWPRAPQPEAQAPAPTPTRPAHPRSEPACERVLLVEDDDGVREAASRALRGAGYQVEAAARGTDALQLLSDGRPPPALLLTDVVMPGMNGREVAEAARRACPGIRVLFMSGYAQDIIVHQGEVEPGLDLLEKPFTPRVLLDRVRAALERPRTA